MNYSSSDFKAKVQEAEQLLAELDALLEECRKRHESLDIE